MFFRLFLATAAIFALGAAVAEHVSPVLQMPLYWAMLFLWSLLGIKFGPAAAGQWWDFRELMFRMDIPHLSRDGAQALSWLSFVVGAAFFAVKLVLSLWH